MKNKLTQLGLIRDPNFKVGKRIGHKIWVHTNYASAIIPQPLLARAIHELNNEFSPNLVRFDFKTNDITLIECPGFDVTDEPVMGRYFSFSGPGTGKMSSSASLLYHHKWLMVKDDYLGFNISKSKMRSIRWKEMAPKDRSFHSRIGHIAFWREWSRCLDSHQNLWGDLEQKFTSKTTSINTSLAPKVINTVANFIGWEDGTVNLDLGGGRFDTATGKLAEFGVTNLIYDPFNRSKEHNSQVLASILKRPVDTVVCSNVLNVIKEPEIKINLVRQAYHSLKEGGSLYVSVYAGNISGTPSQTGKDRWQEHKKLESYEELLLSVFSLVKKVKGIYVCTKLDKTGKA